MNNWKKNHTQIHIDDLKLDIKNPRTDTGARNISEGSVIQELLEENVLDLVRDIAENGYLAVSTLMVVEEDGKKIVIDGNRRLLAAKILNDPHKISKYVSAVKLKNINRIADAKIEDVSSLTGIVYPTRKDAEHEMAILHLTGIAIQQWKPLRQYRYFQKRLRDDELSIESLAELIKVQKNVIKKGVKTYQLYEIAKEKIAHIKNYEDKSIYTDKNFKTDKFQRAVLNEEGERLLGYSFSDEEQKININDEKVFLERMEKVLLELYNSKSPYFSSAQFPVENRTLFFKNVEPSFLSTKLYKKNIKQYADIKNSGQHNLFGIGSPEKLNIVKPASNTGEPNKIERSDRKPSGLFLPSKVPFKLSNTSLQKLYDELKEEGILNFPNAGHDLLRSFLECSLVAYLKHDNIKKYEDALSEKKCTPRGLTLTKILDYVSSNTNSPIKDNSVRAIAKQLIADDQKEYSVERMDMVNHNENWYSTKKNVIDAWTKMEPLFKVILNPKK